MSDLVDSLFLGLIILLTGLSVAFFISRKQENEANRMKIMILILIVISVVLFISESFIFLSLSGETLKSSEMYLMK